MNSLNVRRQEFKYFVNSADLHIVRNSINNLMKLDSYADPIKRKYKVTSLYFDTRDNSALNEKLDGILEREKFRIRIYNNNDSIIKLESKKRNGTVISKESYKISKQLTQKILKGNFEDKTKTGNILFQLKHSGFIPKVIVEYDREAYYLPWGDIRVTFDTDLRTYGHNTDILNIKNHPSTSVFLDNLQIIEIKYSAAIPSYIKNALEKVATKRASISKFVLCQKYSDFSLNRDYLTETF
jgi:hypothetical protein